MTPRTLRSTLERQNDHRAFSLTLRVAQVVCWVRNLSTQSLFKIVRLLRAHSMDDFPIHAQRCQLRPPAPTLMRLQTQFAIYCYHQHPTTDDYATMFQNANLQDSDQPQDSQQPTEDWLRNRSATSASNSSNRRSGSRNRGRTASASRNHSSSGRISGIE